jgi:proteasome lid subunit RPN8/RPN11
MLRLQKATVAAILREAEATPNLEVCGLVWADAAGEQTVTSLRNAHKEPERYYDVDPAELLKAYRQMEEVQGSPVAFYHSHPGGSPHPSEADMMGAMNGGMHYLIVWPWMRDDMVLPGEPDKKVWRISTWQCISMQVLIEDEYEVTG